MEERMKFITEYDLRAQFNEQPFTDYQIEEGTRLTPGARQFLSDRGINLFEDGTKMRFGMPAENLEKQEPIRNPGTAASLPRKAQFTEEDPLAVAKLMSNIEVLEAEFLVITSQIIGEDIETAGQISKVGHEFGSLRSILADEAADPGIHFEDCTGMCQATCCQDLGNCFEISDFYIQSPNGRTLVLLNALRAKTRALRIQAAEALSSPEDEKRLIAVTEGINRIINKLSQMICMAAGVKECKRTQ